jgi:hypothetical protein
MMIIKEQILKQHSKKNVVLISQYIGSDKNKFSVLMDLFFNGEYRITQRSAWVVSHCIDEYPKLLTPYVKKMILNLQNDSIHITVKRNTLRLFQNREIPEGLQGMVVDICFNFLLSQNEPVAVKVFSMTVLGNIAQKWPELNNELRMAIENQIEYESAGFISRGKKELKRLLKNI